MVLAASHPYTPSPLSPSLLQMMAIATLALCYNNRDVFSGVVKIRKGQAVQLIMASTSLESLKTNMAHFAVEVSVHVV